MASFGPRTAPTFDSAKPSNYLAGIGRGAQGFTTRSDIGPARVREAGDAFGAPTPGGAISSGGVEVNFGQAPAGYVAGGGRGMGMLAREQTDGKKDDVAVDNDKGDYSESNYSEFGGYSENLFKDATYEADDFEADRIYRAVDERMDSQRKRNREMQMLQDAKKNNAGPSISDQFADLKRGLINVSASEWDAIPEVGDHSLKIKQSKKKESYIPLPDNMISSAAKNLMGNIDSSVGGDVSTTPLTGLAEARGTILSLKLDKMSDSVSGQTVVDPKGYLTGLNSVQIKSDADISDIKKARTLLTSVTSTNPHHAPGWIAAARIEKVAGKMAQARKLIRQGCEECPDSEDVWVEAAQLHSEDNAKIILANAVKHLPTSVEIWMTAADLEKEVRSKKIVLRRALEFIPNSVKLWKAAIELEDVSDARIMLTRAVECIPHCVDMWLALSKLESYENSKKVLNQAREAIPTEPSIWITASKLEEAHGNGHVADVVIEKAIASLMQYQVTIDREYWLREAEAAESTGAVLTCAAIVKNTIHVAVDEEDRQKTWMDDADACLAKVPPAKETARAIYKYALSVFPRKKSLWIAAAHLEKDHGGNPEALEAILREGFNNCPQAEVLWLMAAKEKWLAGDVPGARAILREAFSANQNSEQIWLAAVKLEWENNEIQRARTLLAKARDIAPTERVWMKSALLEQEAGDATQALALLDTAIENYKSYDKYYMMAGQICDEMVSDVNRARDYYQNGLKNCPESVPLWILASKLEYRIKGESKARSLIEIARLKLPKNELLWLESIRLERRLGNEKLCESLMSRALQECPASGVLWAEEILTCSKTQQKTKSGDAIRKCGDSPHVVLAVARLFEMDRKYAKARKWFSRAVTLDSDLGDAWAYFYAFELKQQSLSKNEGEILKHENTTAAEQVYKTCVEAEPKHGELWCSVSKKTESRRKKVGEILKQVVEILI